MHDRIPEIERRIEFLCQLIERNLDAIKRTEDALIVTNAMLDRQGSKVKDHQEWLDGSVQAWKRHQDWLVRIDRKIEMIADLILRSRGGNGHATEQES